MSSKAHASALSPTLPSQRSCGAVTRLLEGVECSVGQPPSGAQGTPGLPTEPAILQPFSGEVKKREGG